MSARRVPRFDGAGNESLNVVQFRGSGELKPANLLFVLTPQPFDGVVHDEGRENDFAIAQLVGVHDLKLLPSTVKWHHQSSTAAT
jgi:hypothetical protein